MSGLVKCCGVRWSTSLYSDALYQGEGVGHSLDGRCGRCGQPLPAAEGELGFNPDQCGQPLCRERATVRAHVVGGPILHFCGSCGEAFERECALTGVASKVAVRKGVER